MSLSTSVILPGRAGALSDAEKRAVHRLVDASDKVQRAGAAALVNAADGGPVMRCLQSAGTPVSDKSRMAAALPPMCGTPGIYRAHCDVLTPARFRQQHSKADDGVGVRVPVQEAARDGVRRPRDDTLHLRGGAGLVYSSGASALTHSATDRCCVAESWLAWTHQVRSVGGIYFVPWVAEVVWSSSEDVCFERQSRCAIVLPPPL